MLRFFHGSSAASGRELTDECLRRMAGPGQSFIYVVPTARRARSVEKRLLAARPQGFFRPHLLTFYSLVDLLYRRMGGSGVPISQSVKAILVEGIISDPAMRLSYFARRQGRPFPGLVTKLSAFISDLKQNLIDPDAFDQRLAAIEHVPAVKSRELAAIYRRYQEVLAGHRLIDTDGMFWLVLDELEKRNRLGEALSGIDLLIFDGFFDMTLAEGRVLQKLIRQAPNVWLRLDYRPGARCHAATEDFLRNFCTGAERIEIAPAPGSPADVLPPRLFDPDAPPAPEPETVPVRILECRDRLSEVEAIAAEIKQMAADGGFNANRVAVAFKSIDSYAPIVRQVFGSCGIAFNCSRGRPLRESPVAATLMAMLDVIVQDYGRQAVLRFLRSPYVRYGFEYEGNLRMLDGDFLDTEARIARIFRGKDAWAAKLRQSAEMLESGATADEDADPDHRQARLAKLREQCAGVRLALDDISRLAGPLEPAQFGQEFYRLVKRFGIARGIFLDHRDAVDEEILERDYRALERFQKVLDGLLFAAGFSPRKTFDFAEYVEMIEAGLGTEMFDVRREADFGVQVLAADEVRGGDYDVVFLGGMVDGEFPAPESPLIFHSAGKRQALGFKCTPRNLDIERYLFATVAAAPAKCLLLSYPMSDGGAVLLRSLFVSEVERICPWAVRFRHPEPGAVFSRKSLQHEIGAGLSGRDAGRAAQAERLCALADGMSLPAMLRCLAIEEMRRGGEKWSRFEGALADPANRQRIAEHYRERSLTVSKLEKYARCPFRFFAEEVGKLVELEEPQEEIDALERGGVLHRILDRFYTERRTQGRVHLLEEDSRDAVLAHLRAVAERELEQLPFDGLFWEMERERIAGGPARGRRGVLEMFIDAELSDPSSCKPRFFEVTFGHGRPDDQSDTTLALPELVIGGNGAAVRLSGRIDRIEVADAPGLPALVVDYKSGSPPVAKQIEQHLSLQLPVYILALQQTSRGFTPAGGAYYCLKDDPEQFGKTFHFGSEKLLKEHCGLGSRHSKGLYADAELAEVLDGCRKAIVEYAAGIREAVFHPATRPAADAGCAYCIVSGLCRRDEAKAARMAREAANA